jgi:hypothetical protein
MRWSRPPPLTDCCRPPTFLERIVWRLRERFQRRFKKRVKVEFQTFTFPVVNKPWPQFPVEEICTTNVLSRSEWKN